MYVKACKYSIYKNLIQNALRTFHSVFTILALRMICLNDHSFKYQLFY